MDPMLNLCREMPAHILSDFEPAEFLPFMQVSHLWKEIASTELDRKLFLEYAPKEAKKETYRSEYGVESAEHLFCRIEAFVKNTDKTKTTSFICSFPFNPGLFVGIKIYSKNTLNLEQQMKKEAGESFKVDVSSLVKKSEKEAQPIIKQGREEGQLFLKDRTDEVVHFIGLKRLSDVHEKEHALLEDGFEKHLKRFPQIHELSSEGMIGFFSDPLQHEWIGSKKILEFLYFQSFSKTE